jgi:hypothetical protein
MIPLIIERPDALRESIFPRRERLNLTDAYLKPYSDVDIGRLSPSEEFVLRDKGFVLESPNIRISEYACHHPYKGDAIIAHEISHALSYEFKRNRLSSESRDAFLNVRACVSTSNLNYLESESGYYSQAFKDDKLKTEEDMADQLTFRFNKGDKRLFTCSLLIPKDHEKFHLASDKILDDPTDKHSSSVLRVLRESHYKGVELSSSCRELKERADKNYFFNKCEDPK